ncbi:hypothetical protein GCM10009745_44660 [Kribbella yunnanensis]|uniref:Uncharacterized protein n=1 Tax=Kribbella yunnanensis TaxID=190194 RepID=A0ABN2HV98_9ACTN
MLYGAAGERYPTESAGRAPRSWGKRGGGPARTGLGSWVARAALTNRPWGQPIKWGGPAGMSGVGGFAYYVDDFAEEVQAGSGVAG